MSDAPAKKPSSSPAAIGLGLVLAALLGLGMRGCMTQTHTTPTSTVALQAQQPMQALNTAQLAQQVAPATQPVSSDTVSDASAKGQPLLCGPAAAVGLARMFIPRDSGCPQRAPATPPGVIADSSVPAPGITSFSAPPVTDAANPGASVNWYVVRGHPGYTIFESVGGEIINDTPGHHDSRFRVGCWDVLTNSFHVITDAWCYGSAFGFQSTSGEPLEMGYGFMPTARN